MVAGVDAISRRQLSIDLDVHAQSIVVKIAGHVGDRLDLLHPRQQLGHVLLELLLIRSPEHELVLVRRHRGIEREVLLGLQIQLDAGYAGNLVLQALGDLAGAERTSAMRPQIDQETAVVEGGIGAVDADIRSQRGSRRHPSRSRPRSAVWRAAMAWYDTELSATLIP